MKLGVIGTGYVGLVTGTCFAEMGNQVTCLDIDKKKIDQLNQGVIPIYEPGLEEMVQRNHEEGRLRFTTDVADLVRNCEILFIAVGTPMGADGSADLRQVLRVASDIALNLETHRVIVTKSTVPVGTAEKVRKAVSDVLRERSKTVDFDVVSNPEFLKEGAAIEDFIKPDRIVVGVDSERARKIMEELYEPFVRNGHALLFMDVLSSEMTKYVANAMLATKISFMNEVARLCEKTGADVEKVRRGIGTDSRIGFHFIYPGLGYGGSCFPKDVQALVKTGQSFGEPMAILEAVEKVNQAQRRLFVDRMKSHFQNSLRGKKFAIWGLAFKPGTDDIRDAPSLDIIRALLEAGAQVAAYDPVAADHVRAIFPEAHGLSFAKNQYDVLEGAEALCIVTEWKSFREPEFSRMKSLMKNPLIFDGRNQYDPSKLSGLGFDYYSVGRRRG